MDMGSHITSLTFAHVLYQLRKIVRAVRSSPQRRQAWIAEVTLSLRKMEEAVSKAALMLILDVKTRWSSTHQMLSKLSAFDLINSSHVLNNHRTRPRLPADH
jgi:hypothetical protein